MSEDAPEGAPLTVEEARAELAVLRKKRRTAGRAYHVAAPTLIGGGVLYLYLTDPSVTSRAFLLIVPMFLWAVLGLAGVVGRAPPVRYDSYLERIRYLEGYLAAREAPPSS